MISGHTWNIINNSGKDEVYLMHARNKDHFIDDKGNNSNHWFEKKKRVLSHDGNPIECLDSTNVREVMWGPPDSGKEANHLRQRSARQTCQAEHAGSYAQYSARRHGDGVKTPERAGSQALKVPFQERLRDVAPLSTPRVVPKLEWTPRRGERIQEIPPPSEHNMFRKVDQLRTESHVDTMEANFADAVLSARANTSARSARSSMRTTAESALGALSTNRSQLPFEERHLPPKPGGLRQRHSQNRAEPIAMTEITGWFEGDHRDKSKRGDPFFAKPVANMGCSSVKYDIVSNERKEFWY